MKKRLPHRLTAAVAAVVMTFSLSIMSAGPAFAWSTGNVTEHFSDELEGAVQFTCGAASFSLSGFSVSKSQGYGWTGSDTDDYLLIQNTSDGTIHINSGVFQAQQIYIAPYQNSGSVTIKGILGSEPQFTTTINVANIKPEDLSSNGYVCVDLTGFYAVPIDTLEFTLTGGLGGLDVDAFSFSAYQPPVVTTGNISISVGSGTGEAFVIGDTVTATWNNTASGDNNSNITGVTMDFSQFGGGSAVTATNNSGSGNWAASYIILSRSIDATNRNVSVTATNNEGHTKTTMDDANATVDTIAPTVSASRISISGATGTGGVYKIGDTITATWNNTGSGDGNSDISSVKVDFSQFGGGSAVIATNSSGTWSTTYTLPSGSIDAANLNVRFTATDDAGNTTTTVGTTNATVDNIPPTVTAGNIAVTGASGSGGTYKVGDTVTATWNNTASGDDNSAISAVTMDFSQFGGGSAVSATNHSQTWTATYTITSGGIHAANRNVAVMASDDSGNSTTTAGAANATVDNNPPTVTDSKLSIGGASGVGGAYIIGDTITATWNNTASGDNNTDIGSVTVDFSQFGGSSATTAMNSAGIWTATHTITSGGIDATNRNIALTARDTAGNTTTAADTTNATVDNVAPVVTDAHLSIAGATGVGGVYRVGDVVTATWNNTAAGDNNIDTISAVTVDFSQFGGGSAVAATNASGVWTATHTITSGSIDATNRNVAVTVTDNAGNTVAKEDSTNATVCSIAPDVTDGNISIGGGSGPGGAYKIGDTVTVTWDNTALGDHNSNISAVTVDFSGFGGGSAVTAANSAGIWTATYTIQPGSIDGTHRNVSVTATNAGGNACTTADTTNATVDNTPPTVTGANISISGATGPNGTYKIGDTVTSTWDNRAAGDNNADTLSSVTMDFSAFGGGNAVTATNSAGLWTATYTLASGSTDASGCKVTVTVKDNAGNATTTAGATSALVDNAAPVVTDANISIAGATGSNGTYIAGDTVTATWNNTVAGDDNGDISAVTVDFSQFGGESAVTATNSAGQWSAIYHIPSGSIIGINRNVSFTARDDAGNSTTTADTTNARVNSSQGSVTSVSVPANGTYGIGQHLDFIVEFDRAMTVTGTPRMGLTLGSSSVYATYISGSDTSSLVFRYTVAAGDTDTDGIALGQINANGGTIRDAAGNDAQLSLNSVGSTNNVLVDGIAPTVSSVAVPTAGVYGLGEDLRFMVNFGETATVDTTGGVPRLAITLDAGGTVYATYVSGSGSRALVFAYTVAAGSGDTDGIFVGSLDFNGGSIADKAGNAADTTLHGVASTAAIQVDGIAPPAPTLLLWAASDTGASSTDGISNMTAPTVTGSAEPGSTVKIYKGATLLGTTTADGSGTWTYTLQALGSGVSSITAKATDAYGNTSAASSVLSITVDTQQPSASVEPADAARGIALEGNIVVTFDEAMDTGLGQIKLNGTQINGNWNTDKTIYTVPYQGLANSQSCTVQATGFADIAGNRMTTYNGGFTAVADTTAPVVRSVTPSGQDVSTATTQISVTFSEAMDTSVGTAALNGVALTAPRWSNGNQTVVYTLDSVMPGVQYTLALTGFQDVAGNKMTADTSHTFATVVLYRTIAASAGSGGAIAPGGTVRIPLHGTQVFTIVPNANYRVASVTVDGVAVGAVSSYTFTDVTQDHTIAVTFATAYVEPQNIVDGTAAVTVDLTKGSSVLSGSQMDDLSALNATQPVVFTGSGYAITFQPGALRPGSGLGDLDFGLSVNQGPAYPQVQALAGDAFVMMVDFNHSGALPGTAQVQFNVGTQYAGQTLSYNLYDPQSQTLEQLQTVTVAADGRAVVEQGHCSTYVFKKVAKSDDIPKTGDYNLSSLWWLLVVLSAAGIVAVVLRTKRKKVN